MCNIKRSNSQLQCQSSNYHGDKNKKRKRGNKNVFIYLNEKKKIVTKLRQLLIREKIPGFPGRFLFFLAGGCESENLNAYQ